MSFRFEEQKHYRLDSKKGASTADKSSLSQVEVRGFEDSTAGTLTKQCIKADACQGVGASITAGTIIKMNGLGTNGCWVSEENRLKFRITNQVALMKSLIENSPLYKNEYVHFSKETATTIDVLILGIDGTFFYENNKNCLVKEEIWINKDQIDTLSTTFTSHATVVNWVMALALYKNRVQPKECESMCGETWFVPPSDTSPTKSYVMEVTPDFRYLESGKLPEFYGSRWQTRNLDDPLSFAHQPPRRQAINYGKYLSGVSYQFTVASGESKRFNTHGAMYSIDNCGCHSFDRSESNSLHTLLTYRVTGHSVDTSSTPPTTGHLSESFYKVPCIRFPETDKVTIS